MCSWLSQIFVNSCLTLFSLSEFMVDSGSDVVTARQEILDQLDLELIGTIQSRGVHTTVEKQLYKAILRIGKQEAEIEASLGFPTPQKMQRKTRHFSAPSQFVIVLVDQPPFSMPFRFDSGLRQFLLKSVVYSRY